VWTILAVGFVVLVCPPLLLAIALIAGSQRTIFERAVSPDGFREARVQFDDAGAISSFDRMVFVKSRWNPSDEPLLSCRAFWADGEEVVHVHWLDSRTLEIRHAFPAEAVQAAASHCGPVRIVVLPPAPARAQE
jgi:hypothetical protein